MTRLRRRRCHANRTFRQSSEYGLTSSVTRDPSICVLFLCRAFCICSVGPFFCWVAPPVFEGSERFYWGPGEIGVAGAAAGPSPPLGPSLARPFTLARCAAAAAQVTKFRELRDFYGCPKVLPREGISGLSRLALILLGTWNETLQPADLHAVVPDLHLSLTD